MVKDMRTISWTGSSVRLIDQTQLPHRLTYLDIDDVDGLVQAIQRLVIRGAPALGATGPSVSWWRCARGNAMAGAQPASLWRSGVSGAPVLRHRTWRGRSTK